MKRFLWTWVAAAAVIALAFFTVFDGKRLEKKEQESETQKVVLRLPVETITRIEVKSRLNSTVLEKGTAQSPETAWKVTSPYEDEADLVAVESLLNQAETEKSQKTVVEGEKIDWKTYGLDDPVTRLKVGDKNGKSMEVRIGSVRAYDGSLYAQIDDEKKVLLVSSGWDAMLAKLPKDFRNKRPLRQTELKLSDLSRIVVRNKNGSQVELARDGEAWRVKGGLDFPVDQERVTSFFDRIKDFRVRAFAEDAETKKAERALTKAALTVSFFKAAGDKAAFTLEIAPDPDSKSDEYFGRSSDLKEPVLMTRNVLDVFDKTPQDFYDRKRPFRFTAGDVARVEVVSSELKAKFEKKADQWSLVEGEAPAGQLRKAADSAKLDELLKKLTEMQAFRILPDRTKEKFDSRILLKKADGSPVFELAWGASEVEKASGPRPEAHYVRALAKATTGFTIGLSEGDLKNLGLAALVIDSAKSESKEETKTPPQAAK